MKKTFSVILALLIVWLAGFAWYTATSLTMRAQNPTEKTDAIVVLTGGEGRVDTGLSLFAKGLSGNLFISGVHKDVTEPEIRALWKRTEPLPACCIELGRQAHTTEENARETKTWLEQKQFKSIRLVTANYHMHRAVMEFRTALPGLRILENPITQPGLAPKNSQTWVLLLSEYTKFVLRYPERVLK